MAECTHRVGASQRLVSLRSELRTRPHRGRRLGAVLACALLSVPALPVTTASAAVAAGYTITDSHMIGVTPVGFRVYAAPGTAHAQSLAATTSAVSSQLRSLGLPVVFMGYGRPTRVEGIITVAEGSAGCTGSAVTMANTFWYARGLTSGEHFMSRADIVVCPKLYLRPAWQQAAIMRHEFGHAMGLGHMNVVYSRAYQVMNATTHTGISNYGAGDLAGLRYIVAGTARVRIALRR